MYFLTTILHKSQHGFIPEVISDRCFGYYLEKQRAIDAVDKNLADMHEDYYNWLVIEKISEGLHVIPEEEIWYKWDNGLNRWVHIDKPTWSDTTINWSIG